MLNIGGILSPFLTGAELAHSTLDILSLKMAIGSYRDHLLRNRTKWFTLLIKICTTERVSIVLKMQLVYKLEFFFFSPPLG